MATAEATYEVLNPGVEQVVEEKGRQLPAEVVQTPPRRSKATLQVIIGGNLPTTIPESGRILFGALRDPQYRLLQPIPLEVSQEEREIVVSWNEIDEFGCGSTFSAALDDFAQTLRELNDRLNEKDVQLGAELQRIKLILKDYVEPRA